MDRSITRAAAQQTHAMQRSAQRTTLAVSQMSAMYGYAASKASSTVTLAHHLVNAAQHSGRMTPGKLARFHDLTEAYLDDMAYITEEACYDLIRLLTE